MSALTIGITTYLRPKSLARLQASLRRYVPDVPVHVVDTEGNLSAGRNRLVRECGTPYLAILEDDFELIDATSLAAMQAVLDHDDAVHIVGGQLKHMNRWKHFAGDFYQNGRALIIETPPRAPYQETPSGVAYQRCDIVWNYFVGRVEFLREHPWPEDLFLREHHAYFWEIREKHAVAFTPQARAIHWHDRPDDAYKQARSRASTLGNVLRELYGWDAVFVRRLKEAGRG